MCVFGEFFRKNLMEMPLHACAGSSFANEMPLHACMGISFAIEMLLHACRG